jgi:predicted small metal-binding protein
VGFECAGVVRGASKEEVLEQAAAHAREVHKVEVTPELAAKVSSLIQEKSSGN